MADRRVTVKLKADIGDYVRDVRVATIATRELHDAARAFNGRRFRASLDLDDDRFRESLRRAEADARRFAGRRYTARIGVDTRGASRGIAGVRNQLGALSSMKAPAIGVGIAGAAPGVASLVGSAQQLLGILGLVPAAAMGAGAAVGVVVAGLSGFGDAVKKGGAELDKLAPSARAAAVELRSQAAEWKAVQQGIQGALFSGQDKKLDALGRTYLPVVRKAATGIADELGFAARAFEDFALRADSVGDSANGLELTRQAARSLAPVITNLSTIMRDVASVGARELPSLARNFEQVTERWATSIARARATGDMARWMAAGRAEAAQLGRVLADTGGILAGLARASQNVGVDLVGSLERGADAAHRYIDSWEGQAMITQTLAGLRADVAAFTPGLRDLAGMALQFVNNLSQGGTLRSAGEAFSALTASARPTVEVLSHLTGYVLRPLLAVVQGIAPALGPAIAGMIAFRTASAAIGKVQGGLVALGGRFDNAARAASGNAEATSRVSGALNKLGGTLPLIGLALVGAGLAYDELKSKADDSASAVLNGSMSLDAAAQQTYNSLVRQRVVLDPMTNLTILFGTAQEKAALGIETATEALAQNRAAIEAQIAVMPPLQAAQARVTLAQQDLNAAVNMFGVGSPQAVAAAGALATANKNLEITQYAAQLGTDAHTAAMRRQSDQMLGAIDAELRYRASVDAATQAIASNGKTVDLNTQQGRNNVQALNEMARSAQADTDAKRAQEGQTVAVTQRGREHQDQLYKTAIQMGMSRQEAFNYVAQLGLVPANQETRFLTPGLRAAIDGVSELSRLLGAITTANQSREALTGAVSGARNRLNQIGGRATGGPITGPGTGTSDDVLMWGSNGEWVMRKRAVDEQGHGRMAMLNAGRADIVPKGALPGYAGGGPIMGRPSGRYPDVVLDFTGAAAEAKRWASEMFPPPGGGGSGGPGVQRWRGLVLTALAMMGQPASYVDMVLRRMNQESGGNPTIVNNWDSNARRGTPSGGLMQTIAPTYRAYADPRRNLGMFDPLSNILASMRYALARYGSLPAAYNRRGGYADGGTIPGAHTGRDDRWVLAQAGERVLTRTQNRDFERLVSVLDRPVPMPAALRGRVMGGDGPQRPVINQENHYTIRESVDADLVGSQLDFKLRSAAF